MGVGQAAGVQQRTGRGGGGDPAGGPAEQRAGRTTARKNGLDSARGIGQAAWNQRVTQQRLGGRAHRLRQGLRGCRLGRRVVARGRGQSLDELLVKCGRPHAELLVGLCML